MYYRRKAEKAWMFWKKRRFIMIILAFFGFFMTYAMRVNLSVAIVKMTENITSTDEYGFVHHVSVFNHYR